MNKATMLIALIATLLLSVVSSLSALHSYMGLVNYLFKLFHKGDLAIMCKGAFLFFPGYLFLFSFCSYTLALAYLLLEPSIGKGLKRLLFAIAIFYSTTILTSYIDISCITVPNALIGDNSSFINCRSVNYSIHFTISATVSALPFVILLFLRKRELKKG